MIFVFPSPPPFYSYGFGSAGNEKFKIPPDAELQYEVKLKSFEKVRARDEVPKRSGAGGKSGNAAYMMTMESLSGDVKQGGHCCQR